MGPLVASTVPLRSIDAVGVEDDDPIVVCEHFCDRFDHSVDQPVKPAKPV
jgi:hypothetical protein